MNREYQPRLGARPMEIGELSVLQKLDNLRAERERLGTLLREAIGFVDVTSRSDIVSGCADCARETAVAREDWLRRANDEVGDG